MVIHTIPLHAKAYNHTGIMAQQNTSVLSHISSYQQLLEIAYSSEHATYITLLPAKWEWGLPIKCILTSQAVKSFTGRSPFMLHGEDVTRLYDQDEMERQTSILTREIERSPKNRVLIQDVEYLTYSSDASRRDVIMKDHTKKWRYNADFQIMLLEDIGYVRVCSCKERVPV